jgi:hypothetical protein
VRELDLRIEDIMDDDGNMLTPPGAEDEQSPLYAFGDGSWRVRYPISDRELAVMWEIFKDCRATALARGADPWAQVAGR